MNWDALGASGEIIGAVAVLVTLYYLTIQIKIQNQELDKSNKRTRASLLWRLTIVTWAPLTKLCATKSLL